jgi:hypothetical protein
VCSHADGVSLAGAHAALIRCSYCDTPLEVNLRGGGPTAEAKVAGRERPARERA